MSNIKFDTQSLKPPIRSDTEEINETEIGNLETQDNTTTHKTNELEYIIDPNNQALVVIFNMVEFEKGEDREGSDFDVERLISIFSKLGMKINDNNIYENKTSNEVNNIIHSIAKDLQNNPPSSFICVFSTHGGPNEELSCKKGSIYTDNIYKPIAELKELEGKPKLFIFQACKSTVTPDDSPETYVVNATDKRIARFISDKFWKMKTPKDILIAYSTIEDEVSLRTQHGTWYIQELCNNISGYAKKEDVQSLLVRTQKCVTKHCYERYGRIAFKQMPIFISTLTKKWFLTNSKDRNY